MKAGLMIALAASFAGASGCQPTLPAPNLVDLYEANIVRPFDPRVEAFPGVDYLSGRGPVLEQLSIPKSARVLEAFRVVRDPGGEGFCYYVRFEVPAPDLEKVLAAEEKVRTVLSPERYWRRKETWDSNRPDLVVLLTVWGGSDWRGDVARTESLGKTLVSRLKHVCDYYRGPWGFYALFVEPPRRGAVTCHVLYGPHFR